MGLYQVCSDGGRGVQNGPAAGGGLGLKNEMYLKIFYRSAWLRCLKYVALPGGP